MANGCLKGAIVGVLMFGLMQAAAAVPASSSVYISTQDDDCADVYSGDWMDYESTALEFGVDPLVTSDYVVEMYARIIDYTDREYSFDAVTCVNGQYVSSVSQSAMVMGSSFSWYAFDISADMDSDGLPDDSFSMRMWSSYNAVKPAVAGIDVIRISLDYDNNGVADYNETSVIPEPATVLLLGTALAGVAVTKLREKRP